MYLMSNSIAFYAGLVYEEYDGGQIPVSELPEGIYIRSDGGNEIFWYVKQFGSLTPINHCDIPKNLLALCLILGLT